MSDVKNNDPFGVLPGGASEPSTGLVDGMSGAYSTLCSAHIVGAPDRVAAFASMEDVAEFVAAFRRIVTACGANDTPGPRWCAIVRVLGVRRADALQICKWFALDENELVGRVQDGDLDG